MHVSTSLNPRAILFNSGSTPDLSHTHVPLLNRNPRDILRADDDPRPTLRNQLAHPGRALRVRHRDGYVYNFSYPRPY
jgi:hypothetical protein